MGLVLLVSMGSFFLGIMMGKRVAPAPAPAPEVQTAPRIPVTTDQPVVEPAAPQAPEPPEGQAPKLTFYETLPRSQGQPLGTGLNSPPAPPAKPADKPKVVPAPVAAVVTPAPKTATRPGSVAVSSPAPAAAPAPVSPSTVAAPAAGGVVVQVGAFRKKQDAETLIQRLRKKGYVGTVMDADVAGKGVWYRAMVGPYKNREAAASAAQRLQREEKVAVLVRQL
jgi:cell division protein FtsN